MIGMFAVSEIIRNIGSIDEPWEMAQTKIGNVFRGMWTLTKRYPMQTLRGSVLGTAIGALPGAGADIAAWMSYAMSKCFSKEPEKFGTGHIEGIIEAGASNNSALAGAWIPALVFGIPGDSITAIVIGVLYIKGLNPGPTIFMNNAPQIYAIFLVFIPGEPADAAAGRRRNQRRQADAARAARSADAGDPAFLRGRLVRHQQFDLRRGADARLRSGRLRHGRERLPGRAGDPGQEPRMRSSISA